MKRTIATSIIILTFFFSNQLFAQSSAIAFNDITETENVLGISSSDWSFYIDEEQNLYYIDFEKINVNLSDIKLYNENGELLMQDYLYNLPVNTIYELDLSDYASGKYRVELRTYTEVMEKEIEVR